MHTEVIGVVKQLHAIETLEDLLLKTIDETIKQIFKEAGTPVIYNFLEANNGLNREEIAEKPEVFSTGMKRLLGSGAPVIEKLILKNLYRKLELQFGEKEDYRFSDYVAEIRRSFE